MVAVDANVLLRSLVRDDARLAAQADEMIKKARPSSLLLDRLIIAECTYVLRSYYQFDKSDISSWVFAVLGDQRFSIPDRETVQLTAELFARERPLSFEDCWLLALQRSGAASSVATLDAGLAKRVV